MLPCLAFEHNVNRYPMFCTFLLFGGVAGVMPDEDARNMCEPEVRDGALSKWMKAHGPLVPLDTFALAMQLKAGLKRLHQARRDRRAPLCRSQA